MNNHEVLDRFANAFKDKDINLISDFVSTTKVELVNTNEILLKKDYLEFLKERLNNKQIKIERTSTYNDIDALAIYTLKCENSQNYKVVSFYNIENNLITKIEEYWFLIF